MTIVTISPFPKENVSFGNTSVKWLIDTGTKIAGELLGFDISKYAELPPVGSAISLQPKKKRKFSRKRNKIVQKNFMASSKFRSRCPPQRSNRNRNRFYKRRTNYGVRFYNSNRKLTQVF